MLTVLNRKWLRSGGCFLSLTVIPSGLPNWIIGLVFGKGVILSFLTFTFISSMEEIAFRECFLKRLQEPLGIRAAIDITSISWLWITLRVKPSPGSGGSLLNHATRKEPSLLAATRGKYWLSASYVLTWTGSVGLPPSAGKIRTKTSLRVPAGVASQTQIERPGAIPSPH